MATTIELYFDGKSESCAVTTDANGEYLCTAPSGRFAKFPAGADLKKAAARHNAANSQEVEIIPGDVFGETITFDKNGDPVK